IVRPIGRIQIQALL
ncbi:hypothetical protein D047_1899, partial [Vibrio parahaemolyticus VPTS-2010_2]